MEIKGELFNKHLEIFRPIWKFYQEVIQVDPNDYAHKRVTLKLPNIPILLLRKLINDIIPVFQSEPIVLQISSPVVVVGDLHGHILDLFRIFKDRHPPPETKYVFLGDYVDRGPFSLETITLLFILKILYPKHIYLIRGNHEFKEICSSSGFFKEIFQVYQEYSLCDLFEEAFSYLPLAAIIDHSAICVHGGLGPTLTNINDIFSISRPFTEFPDGLITDLLWSDPSEGKISFKMSSRGSGYCFGSEPLSNFLASTNLSIMIRGHQCVMDGIQYMFSGQLITVFSASNYCGNTGNKAGIYIIKGQDRIVKTYSPMPLLIREDALFIFSSNEISFQVPQLSSLPGCEKKVSGSLSGRPIRSSQSSERPVFSCKGSRLSEPRFRKYSKPPIPKIPPQKKNLRSSQTYSSIPPLPKDNIIF